MGTKWIVVGVMVSSASLACASPSIAPGQSDGVARHPLIQLAQRNQAVQQQQRPAPRAAAPAVQRAPAMRQQQPAGQRGQIQHGARAGMHPGAQPGATNRSAAGGAAGPGVHGAGGGGMAAPQTPRSQLYDMVRPAPVSTNVGRSAPVGSPAVSGAAPASGQATRAGPAGANLPRAAAFSKPAHISHNPARKAGTAGFSHQHRPFVFRRAGYVFYRHYYVVSGVWYWYEAPVEPGDPAFALADDPDTPVCEEDVDECG
jgi:hypothetical protein